MWEAKVIAAAVAAETNWKLKVVPDWGDLMISNSLGVNFIQSGIHDRLYKKSFF